MRRMSVRRLSTSCPPTAAFHNGSIPPSWSDIDVSFAKSIAVPPPMARTLRASTDRAAATAAPNDSQDGFGVNSMKDVTLVAAPNDFSTAVISNASSTTESMIAKTRRLARNGRTFAVHEVT